MKPSINLRYKSLLLTCLLILSARAGGPAGGGAGRPGPAA